MRIVLDTNVLIAAFISQGYCHELYEHACLEHTILVSKQIIAELQKNFTKKFGYSVVETKAVVDFIEAHSNYVPLVKPLPQPVCRDRSDDGILALAVQAKAAVIFTGDMDLLSIKYYKHIPILRPNVFWEFERKYRK